MTLTKEENLCLFKSFQTFDFRGLWYGRKSCESLWSGRTQVLGTLHSHKLPCNKKSFISPFSFMFPLKLCALVHTENKTIILRHLFSFFYILF